MYMCWSIFCILNSKLVVPIRSCKLEPVHGRAPACLHTCSSWGRKVEHPHSQGLSELRGLAGVHTCTGQLSLNICHILMLMLGSLSLLCRISYHIISYHISYHIIAPTLAPNPTHPCCMPPIYRKPSPKRGKSALKTTLTNIYIKSTNIVKTPGEIITNCTGCMWYHRPRHLEATQPIDSEIHCYVMLCVSFQIKLSFILFDLCLFITIFNFILNYVPIVTFWIFTYHKIWILLIIFCFIWSYWIIYFFKHVWKCFGVLWVNWCQFAVALANKVKIGLAF